MSINNDELLRYLNQLLSPEKVKDYCPNGLQIEGKREINKIVCGVTASQALIDAAISENADAIFVHHGYFWKGENPCITGMKKQRFASLLTHDINLYAYHLPLDIHPDLGNNAQLAKRLNIETEGGLEADNPVSVAMRGNFNEPTTIDEVGKLIEAQLERTPLIEATGPEQIKTVAWCTGGGQGYIDLAAEQGIDLFITGEVSEQTIHSARENGIHFIAAGHHATERYGAKAVGEHLQETLGIDTVFIDIDNPA